MTEGKWSYSMYLKRGDFTLIRLEAEGKKLGILYGLKEENEANARLIAAAPGMYELLKKNAEDLEIAGLLRLSSECKELLARIEGKEMRNHEAD